MIYYSWRRQVLIFNSTLLFDLCSSTVSTRPYCSAIYHCSALCGRAPLFRIAWKCTVLQNCVDVHCFSEFRRHAPLFRIVWTCTVVQNCVDVHCCSELCGHAPLFRFVWTCHLLLFRIIGWLVVASSNHLVNFRWKTPYLELALVTNIYMILKHITPSETTFLGGTWAAPNPITFRNNVAVHILPFKT